MKLEELRNKKILILGFGTEGKSVFEFLKHNFPNQEIAIADQKQGSDYLEKQRNYDLAVKSPGIQKSKVLIAYTTAVNIFFANVKGITVGITGSKGKSTTSSLLYEILKKAEKKVHLVGNITHKQDPIGTPMLSELLKSNTPEDIWICELSSFMLDDIQYSPHISVMTSFFPEHIDYHGSLDEYLKAKSKIISFSKASDYFVYNQKFKELEKLTKITAAKAIPFIDHFPLNENEIPLIGKHNAGNIKAAITVARILKVSDENIMSTIKNFKPLPHRLENAGIFRGITFYDDAISTAPESTIHAIETLKNIGTIFLGGQDREFDFSELAKVIVGYNIQNMVLFPESGEKIYGEIKKITKRHFNVLHTSDMKEAIIFAFEKTPKGSICLLSTASPSYSIWENFEEKGNLFKKLAKEIGFEKNQN